MSGWWQVALLLIVIAFAVSAGMSAAAESSTERPIFGLLFWLFGGSTAILAAIFGLTFL